MVIKDRFLPPPMPLAQTDDGLGFNLHNQHFPSLFATIAIAKDALPSRALRQFPKGIPYDYACPNLQKELSKRVCLTCGLYTSSVTSCNAHCKECKKTQKKSVTKPEVPTTGRKVRPVRLGAKRQRELMCAIAYSESTEELEWFDEEDVDTSGLSEPDLKAQGPQAEAGTPVISVSSRNPLWKKL